MLHIINLEYPLSTVIKRDPGFFAIGGNTYDYRTEIKAAGLKWDKKRNLWKIDNREIAEKLIAKINPLIEAENARQSEIRQAEEARRQTEYEERMRRDAEIAERNRMIAEERTSLFARADAVLTKKPSVGQIAKLDLILKEFKKAKFVHASIRADYDELRDEFSDYFSLKGYPRDLRKFGSETYPNREAVAERIISQAAA